jgi:Mor family transcriptional regulator
VADAIADLIARLRARLGEGASVSVVDQVEREVREQWGGQWVYVSGRGDPRVRNSMIIDARLKGKSIAQIAREFGLKPRQVRNILRKGP